MSWRRRLGQLVAEFGEDVVQQASRVLASDATEAQARKTLERVMRTVPEGVDFAVPRPAAAKTKRTKAVRPLTQEGYVEDKAQRQANLDRFKPYRGEGGEPVMFYHGTDRDITNFDVDARRRIDAGMGAEFTDTGWFGKGIYLTPSAYAASGYAGKKEGANVMPVYASMRNPFEVRGLGGRDMDRFLSAAGAPMTPEQMRRGYRLPSEQTAWLRAQGYDSVRAFDPNDPGAPAEIVVFEPTQIKSATGNRGTYDPNDPDIRKARGGLAVKRKKGKR